ncbi:MAG: TonB-dependent receptor [Bacteroidales bacterium]|nr:TonB-dependent receptor [Bacteroidales bacterium]
MVGSAPVLASAELNPLNSESPYDTLSLYSLDEAVVVSERVNQHNLAPLSASVISAGQLQALSVAEVSNLSGVLPNVFIPEYGSRQTRPISIRGVMSKVKGSAVGYYIDGMPRFEVSSFDMDMLDVSSIEVLRGPQSTLYGRNTLGGLISVHTYSPFDYQGTRARLSYGNYNSLHAQASHYGKAGENVGYNVSAYYQHTDGFFDNETLDEKTDPLDAAGGKVAFYWRPADNWELRFTSQLDYLDQGGYPYAPYDVTTGELSPITYNRASGYERLISHTGLRLRYEGDGWSLNSQTSFEHIDDDQRIDQDFTANDLYFVTNGINNNVVSEELTLKSEDDGRLQWVAGVSGFVQHYNQTQCTDYIVPTMNRLQTSRYTLPTESAAIYGQLSYNLVAGLSATVGARLDYEHSRQKYGLTVLSRSTGTETVQPNKRTQMENFEFIPKFGLLYQFNEQNSLFGNVSRGYKAGGFNTTFQTDSERTYKPEYNWNYEAGVRLANADRTISGDLTLFYIDWEDQHINRTVPGVGNIIYNAGHSNSKGIEANLRVRPLENLLVQGSYGYTYAQFLDYKKSETVDYSGKMTPMVPRHTLSALANYDIYPSGGLDRISITANVTGMGKLYWVEDNQEVQPFYALLGAKVALVKGAYTLELWGKNLTDTDYLSYYFASSAKYAQQGKPMTMGVTVDVRF